MAMAMALVEEGAKENVIMACVSTPLERKRRRGVG